jgi:hypothetical protein
MRRISTPNIQYETFDSVGEAVCPQCGVDQVFSLGVDHVAISTTYHLVCNKCEYKTAISPKTARMYMPHRPVWQTHAAILKILAFVLMGVASAVIVLIRGK